MLPLEHRISPDDFYKALDARLEQYALTIAAGLSPLLMQMLHAKQAVVGQLRTWDHHYVLYGKGFWGYGINTVCDGRETITQPDIAEIKKDPERNKHHRDYRALPLLIFRVERQSLFVSLFSVDSVNGRIQYDLNTEYDLRKFKTARTRKRGNQTIVDLMFEGLDKPIHFEVDYRAVRNSTPESIAALYINTIKSLAGKARQEDSAVSMGETLSRLERELRKVIATTLENGPGGDSYAAVFPSDSKAKTKRGIRKMVEKYPNLKEDKLTTIEAGLEECDMSDYQAIILKRENWPQFAKRFKSESAVRKRFEQLTDLRNALRHEKKIALSEVLQHDGHAALLWLEQALELKS